MHINRWPGGKIGHSFPLQTGPVQQSAGSRHMHLSPVPGVALLRARTAAAVSTALAAVEYTSYGIALAGVPPPVLLCHTTIGTSLFILGWSGLGLFFLHYRILHFAHRHESIRGLAIRGLVRAKDANQTADW